MAPRGRPCISLSVVVTWASDRGDMPVSGKLSDAPRPIPDASQWISKSFS